MAGTQQGTPQGAPPRWFDAAVFATLGIATALVFGRSLENSFVWDTLAYFQNAPAMGLTREFLAFAWVSLEGVSNWLPLTWISWAVDAELYGGIDTRGFHLTNVVLHWIVACLVYVLFIAIERHARDGSRGSLAFAVAAALATLVWCVHPQRVEVVTWVAQRKELLSTLFMLLAALAYLEARTRGSKAWYAASLGAFVFAGLSKPMAVVLPPLLVLLEFFPLAQRRGATIRPLRIAATTAPFFVLGLGLAGVTLAAQQGAMAVNEGIGLDTRIVHAFSQTVVYLQKTILPLRLSPFYPFPDPYPMGLQAIVAILVVTGITAGLGLALLRRGPGYGAAVAWFAFLVCLVPVIGVVKVGLQAGADRYTYVALLPLHLLAAFGATRLAEDGTKRAVLVAATLAVAVLFGALAREYTTVWRDRGSLWEHAAAHYPGDDYILLNRALAYYGEQQFPEADRAFLAAFEAQAFEEQPGHLIHWALVKVQLGDYEAALSMFGAARSFGFLPGCTDYNMAWNLAQLGRLDEARDLLAAIPRDELAPALREIVDALQAAVSSPAPDPNALALPICNDRVRSTAAPVG